MIILIDNYDSFTYNIFHYISEFNEKIKIYRNDEISIREIENINPKAIVISPGPGIPENAGISVKLVQKTYKKIPILGICLGHQVIGKAFGGEVSIAPEIMHGKIDKITHNNHPVFNGVSKEFAATRYHSLIIEKKSLPNDFEIIAKTKNDIIMGIAHKNKNIFGFQFHPESIGTLNGKTILKNFLNIINYES